MTIEVLQHMTIGRRLHTQDKDKHLQLMTTGRLLHMQDKGEHQLYVGMALVLGLEHLLLRNINIRINRILCYEYQV